MPLHHSNTITLGGNALSGSMICTRCILDDSVADIRFDEHGVCNYCTAHISKKHSVLKNESQLNALLKKLKPAGSKNHCIVGVSGGLDSSFLLYKAVTLGLNPIAVHVDTGWNTETSVYNIETLTRKLNVKLETLVLNWEQFSDLQLAYLKAGVIDMEFPTDHYYLAALYKMASKLGVRYILTGNNYTSEGIMPDCWIHNKGDTTNMLDIYKKFGSGRSLNRLPTMTLWKKFYYYNLLRIENVFLLNYFDYDREQAKATLIKNLGWREHPVKHGETIYTRFYQRYILPVKFKVDIRRAHLSALICNGQLTRQEALDIIENQNAPAETACLDKMFVLKKLGISDEVFVGLMNAPTRQHSEFRSDSKIKAVYNKLVKTYGFGWLLKISNRT